MIRSFVSSLFICIALLAGPALAVTPDEVLNDPALEARARALSAELRCMVCQNQSIDDSDAPLAKDLRILVRERLVAGDSDEEVINFLVSRYGEFVLLKPRFAWHTLVLWAAGPLALVAGVITIFVLVRRGRNKPISSTAEPALSDEEKRRLNAILESGRDV